mmetsp:Transcript_1086/g.1535  ORF Transcript_1086/g.1535 Transcript_1086/m.1535 type:complete len:232 (-) Transcript_1086:140-835(-)|eukprot:CAMPEP_0185264114 /NCGR_PEP_ID=MMETSP1359-20130426/19103_1 /TAXON_ID=552665 /ORGANISM="Bigelowiella longifila, Strain CCMP242" /LENGTH=231 /DNA_ID=CAMNT_0027852253 /DNA_START=26 /DNA_END=721 /DNA_ORIENTATION=-
MERRESIGVLFSLMALLVLACGFFSTGAGKLQLAPSSQVKALNVKQGVLIATRTPKSRHRPILRCFEHVRERQTASAPSEMRASSTRRGHLLGGMNGLILSATAAASSPFLKEAKAIGTTKDMTVPVEILGYEEIECPEGSPKKMRCVKVTATLSNPTGKVAKGVSMFGFVKYSELDTDALWSEESNFCGAVDEVQPGANTVSFVTQLRKYKGFTGSEPVGFNKVRARLKT